MKKYLALALLAAFTVMAPPRAVANAAYPLKICVVSGDDLGDDPVDVNYKGRTIRLCCKSCVKKFNANPTKYMTLVDQELAKKNK